MELPTTCPDCGAALPRSVLDAADLLYGPDGLGYVERLRRAVERTITNLDASPFLGSDPDEEIGRAAVLDALGLESFEALTLAYRHHGKHGDCRP